MFCWFKDPNDFFPTTQLPPKDAVFCGAKALYLFDPPPINMLIAPYFGAAIVIVVFYVDPLDMAKNLFPGFGAYQNMEVVKLKPLVEALFEPRDIFAVMLARGGLKATYARTLVVCWDILFQTGSLTPQTVFVIPKNEDFIAAGYIFNVIEKLKSYKHMVTSGLKYY